ncbi:polynucleotide adenylyltransferase PcnB [Psychrobacter sp. 1U2]|uniref:polynucleotide adenylyltransferase PcnB n=1 Tax=Psychrobacter sp. 1U2 TaxID=3453577 RepID=UPI003F463C28
MAERAAKKLELNKSELPNSITEVIATLSRAGFDAYIVGGGVRDTLLGLQPKDFDAVTDAKPHEIKDVFGKRCRIIGRRFQLAHVYSGRELIEVATFRGPPNNNASTNQDGMILRDNVWGDIKQDFARRDFSINALYYQPLKGVVHDFCGALEDIDNQVIRLLGHAPVRIEEDPVRLLRALRFKAKLGFEFDKELSEQFHDDNWALLEQISPHRLYDETQKMFTGGYLVPLLPLLFEYGAIDSLIIYPPSEPSPLVQQVAINTDKRIAAGKSINPAFFYAALLWENYLHQLEKAKNRNMPFAEAQLHAAGKVIDRQRIKTAIPKFAEQFIRDIWILQPKLAAPRNKQIEQLAEHPRFRAGFDFLLLREQCGDAEHPLSESTNGMGEWWQTYQTLSEKEQQQAIADFDENIRRGAYKKGQRGRGRNRQKQNDNAQATAHSNPDQVKVSQSHQAANDTANVPSRRRRRNTDKAATQNNNLQAASSEQLKQDSQELEQLQQLSLAATKPSHKKPAAPKPLFVIEHEKVVPPLKKQLDDENKSNSANGNVDNKASASRGAKSSGRKVSAKNKAAVANQENVNLSADNNVEAKSAKASAATKANTQPSKAKHSEASVSTAVPQTPKSVASASNSEPIPSKRRRKPLNLSEPAVNKSADKALAASKQNNQTLQDGNASKGSNSSKDDKAVKSSSAKAEKKASTAKTSATQAKLATNKGAIPAKRRRRQPSNDNA